MQQLLLSTFLGCGGIQIKTNMLGILLITIATANTAQEGIIA